MRIGIVGGGLMGIALAYFLSKAGERVVVLEQSAEVGGLSARIQFGDGLAVARYQHAILPTDQHTRRLCSQLGLDHELAFDTVRTGFISDNQVYPMTSLRDFMFFTPLTFKNRLQLGTTLLKTRWLDQHQMDTMPVKDWLIAAGGVKAFQSIWQPLLEAKFDGQYDAVPAAYIKAWISRMLGIRHLPYFKGKVGNLRRGHYSLIQAMAEAISLNGGQVATQSRVREIIVEAGRIQAVRTHSDLLEFDLVIGAIATPTFARLVPGADKNYLERLGREKYLGLICPVMVLDRPLTNYWTLNQTDPNSPFSSITEIPHPVLPNRHIVYLPRYTASDNDWMGVSDDDIREAWLAHLKLVFSHFDEKHVLHLAVSRSRYVEPVYSIHANQKAVPVQTPYSGLFLANTGQVYPELPTSEAVIAHAEQAANLIRQSALADRIPA